MAKATKKHNDAGGTGGTIALNRKARHNYTFEQRFEAGLVLQGWEVKSIRAGRVQISESHVIVRRGEAWLINTVISPLISASTHIKTDDSRSRKLLLHSKEINVLLGSIERKGYTIVPTAMYWKKNKVKIELALAKGKKDFDKRASEKDRDWERDKARMMRSKKS